MPSNDLSAQIIRQEIDLSAYIGGSPGVYTVIVLESMKGPTDPILITNEQQFIQMYGSPENIKYKCGYSAVTYLRYGGNKLWVKRITKTAAYAALVINAPTEASPVAVLPAPLNSPNNILFTTGSTAPAGTIALGLDSLFVLYARDPGVSGKRVSLFIKQVLDMAGNATDEFIIKVYCDDEGCDPNDAIETWYVSRNSKKDGEGKQMYIEDVINNNSQFLRCINNTLVNGSVVPADWTDVIADPPGARLSGGSDGVSCTDADYINGLLTFKSKDNFPMRASLHGGVPFVTYLRAKDDLALNRKDHISICTDECNIAAGSNYINSLVDWRKNTLMLDSSYSMLFSPNVKWYDNYSGKTVTIPIDGFVAAAISTNFYQREIWYPPAGWNYGKLSVEGVSRIFDLSERDYLYQNGINPVRFKPGRGAAIWGQKTMQFAKTARDRFNVRMTLIEIEEGIEAELENFEFEFNDETTRARGKATFDSYLEGIKARRGLTAFMVRMDETNNTSEVIDGNMMYVDVFVQIPRVAEIIVFRTIITRTGVDFAQITL